MFFGAIRTTIAECIYGMFGVPLAALVVVIYRAIFLFVMFEFGLLLLGGFLYNGQFRGFSPKAFVANFVDGNVVVHGNVLKGGCNVIGEVFLNKDLFGTDDVTPVFGVYNMWEPGRKITAAEYAEHDRQVAVIERQTVESRRCELLYARIGGTLVGGHKRWYQLSDAERANTTWPDFFRRIEPELKAEREGCGPMGDGRGGYYFTDYNDREVRLFRP